MNRTRLVAQLRHHEGDRRKPYRDTAGHLTIGVGRNLDAKPLSDAVVQLMLDEDINEAWQACQRGVPGFDTLSEARQHALLDMTFNMGPAEMFPPGVAFYKMLAAVERRDFTAAAVEMLDSVWARQVGGRAATLAKMMKEGTSP
jgi:lysozyme